MVLSSTTESTKVYYYLDDNTPYLSVIPVSDQLITLGDFKKVFAKKGYKYFCKQLDETIGCEVKVEICDDATKLEKSANGLIELVLMSIDANHAFAGTLPRIGNMKAQREFQTTSCSSRDYMMKKRRSLYDLSSEKAVGNDSSMNHFHAYISKSTENSVTASSLSTVISKRAGERLADHYTSNSEDRIDSRFSVNSGACSSSYGAVKQNVLHHKAYRRRKPRKQRYRRTYVPSTISSVSESSITSLSLPRIDVVTLPMKSGTFLGISVLSHDGGIFVSDIIKGGAVALDGRIEVGDQIIQVNRSSFENLTDLQAVQLLRQAAASKKPITLYLAKRPCNTDSRHDVFSGLASETMPIDVSLWVECTKQSNVKPVRPFAVDETVSTKDDEVFPLGNETETDVEGAYIERRNGISLKNKDIAPQDVQANLLNAEDVDRRRENEENEQLIDSLNVSMDPSIILKQMTRIDSGLQIKNRKWLKIPVPMSFIGCDLVDWLIDHVEGIKDRKSARIYASKLLSEGYIRHVVNKLTFTEKCYYIFDESILSTKIGVQTGSNCKTGPEATTEITYVGSPTSQIPRFGLRNSNNLGNFTYTKKNITLDEPWPLSALSNGSSFKRKDCDSFMVNDYASVIAPDIIASTMPSSVGEIPYLKRPYAVSSVLTNPRLIDDDIRGMQPPNTPNSVIDQSNRGSAASETEFEVIDDEGRNIACATSD